MAELIIPVGVARAVWASQWYNTLNAADGTADSIVANAFAQAKDGGWKRNMPRFHAEILQAMIDALVKIRAEDGLTKAEAGALENFTATVQRWLDRRLIVEKREAEEQAARKVKDDAESRAYATERRERPLSPHIESQRFSEIRQIGEDYGLDLKDVRIRAALVAAFHVGAHSMTQASNRLLFNSMAAIDQEKWDERFAKDKAMFERARESTEEAGE